MKPTTMNPRYLFHLLLVSFLVFACSNRDNRSLQEESKSNLIAQPAKLDSILSHYVDNGAYPFLYARLENRAGEVLYEFGKVNKDVHPNRDVNGQSWIRIWSMSKIVTISITLDLIEEGILNFDDPVVKYIPEFENLKVAVSKDGIPLSKVDRSDTTNACPFELVAIDSTMTILHLLNHQAGFYYATTGFDCLDDPLAEANLPMSADTDEFLSKLANLPLILHPGESEYYGTNTTVLGMVSERATGKTLKELVEERLTGPLNIAGLQYGLPEGVELFPAVSGKDSILRYAEKGELDIFGPDVVDYAPDHSLYLGGEGMLATADGYADFLRMLLAHGELNGVRYLEDASVKDMYAPHTDVDNAWGHNGYNLWVTSDSARINGYGDAGLWQGGGYEGTSFWVDPKRDFVAVFPAQKFVDIVHV
jgi:CubicO group peptidase (beta-lactamase class C family)